MSRLASGPSDLTDILDQRDRDYCIAVLRSRCVGGADVWGIVYVAAGLGYLPSLYMATEAETRTGHNSNRNQQ